ncbi:TetR/AcrR family transcriptional regulator [Nocardia miyunensis]|uniref:TetR/AcrR family transcriptional regulator n=1 Tax=Nocardia miyunensis TaxID=282684 RepID=UPI00083334AE|nr:TetR/AcrR family transcriptional regulator [Nocardia miyunensis]
MCSLRRYSATAAADLLDRGGPDAGTLREVGARAGVSRGAPSRHFPDKDSLLTTIAAEALDRLADQVQAVRAAAELPPADTLRRALAELMTVGRHQPHLYRLMFETPRGDPAAVHAATRAAERFETEFHTLITDLVGARRAPRFGALVLTSVHGVTTMDLSGHLAKDKWQVSPDDLVTTLIGMIAQQAKTD